MEGVDWTRAWPGDQIEEGVLRLLLEMGPVVREGRAESWKAGHEGWCWHP